MKLSNLHRAQEDKWTRDRWLTCVYQTTISCVLVGQGTWVTPPLHYCKAFWKHVLWKSSQKLRMRPGTFKNGPTAARDYQAFASFHRSIECDMTNACCRLGGRDISAELAPHWKQWLIKTFGAGSVPADAEDSAAGKIAHVAMTLAFLQCMTCSRRYKHVRHCTQQNPGALFGAQVRPLP